MTTATQSFEGTAGTFPSALSGSYGTFTVASGCAGVHGNNSTSDFSLSSTVAHGGSTSARVGCADATNNTLNAYHACSSPASLTYWRGYVYLTAAPDNGFSIAQLRTTDSQSHLVGISTDRRLFVSAKQTGGNFLVSTNTTSGTTNDQSTANAIPLNEWFRVEAYLTTGTVTARLYKTTGGGGVESTGTPDVEVTASSALTGSFNNLIIGPLTWNGSAVVEINGPSVYQYHDDWAIDTAGWVGPTSATVGASFAGIVPI